MRLTMTIPTCAPRITGGLRLVALGFCLSGLPASEAPAPPAGNQGAKLLSVTSIYVDKLNGGLAATRIRDMIIGSVQRTGLFVITEDEARADAFLRGSANDLVYTDYLRDQEAVNVRGSSSRSRRDPGDSRFDSGSFGIAEREGTLRREHKHEAGAAVRLVLKNGEVIWSTTEESSGAKYRGAAADVAEKVAKQLVSAYRAAGEKPQPSGASPRNR